MASTQPSEVLADASANNSAATATAAAVSGRNHRAILITAGYEGGGNTTGTLTIKDGSTTIATHAVQDTLELRFGGEAPLEFSKGNKAVAELSSSGAADNVGHVEIYGYTY